MSRKPALKPNAGNREELLERRVAALEARMRAAPARTTPGHTTSTTFVVSKTAHGLAVKNVVRHDGTNWVKSQADTAANAVVGGMVIAVLSPDVFVVAMPGSYVSGLSSLTAGSVHYLDETTAGAMTTTAPTIQVPILLADTATSGIMLPPSVAPSSAAALAVNFDVPSSLTAVSISPITLAIGDRFTVDIMSGGNTSFSSLVAATGFNMHLFGKIDSETTWSACSIGSGWGLGTQSSAPYTASGGTDRDSISASTATLAHTLAGVAAAGSAPATATETVSVIPDFSAYPITSIKVGSNGNLSSGTVVGMLTKL
jgi:hypothetical protein